MHTTSAIVLAATAASCVLAQTISITDPQSVPHSYATCVASDSATGKTKDIPIRYTEFNPQAERTLLLVHGWPGLWHVWKNQIEYFKNDYHLVVPNQRGFPGSGYFGDIQTSSTMGNLVADLACVLEHAKVSKAVCVGHDWGSQVCYEAARLRPDIFEAVIGTCIPYMPYGGPYVPIEELVPEFPELSYNIYFQNHTSKAAAELSSDTRRTLRATLRTVDSPPPNDFLKQTDSYLTGWDSIAVIPPIPFFTPVEEDYWVQEFEESSFNNTLGFYTYGSRHGSWTQAHADGNFSIPQPVLSILSSSDPVADWPVAAGLLNSAKYLPQLTTKTVPAAHWLQLERPDDVNGFMKEWLDQYYPPTAKDAEGYHVKDEL